MAYKKSASKWRYYRNYKTKAIIGFRAGYGNAYKRGAQIVKKGRARGFKVVKGPMGSEKLLLRR